MEGQIIKALSGFYYVESNGKIYQTRGRGNFRKKNQRPLVGDKVTFESTNDKEGMITHIFERHNILKRPNVANVDQVIIVMSLVEPTFSTQLLDRFIVQAESLHIQPILYWSKLDLVTDIEKVEAEKAKYEAIGYPVLLGEKEQVNPALYEYLPGKLTVVMGQSGVGKSTLLNALHPSLHLETSEISDALGRGKHTTRHIELWSLHEGKIVDTPGFSALEFDTLTIQELSKCFIEFKKYSVDCKFRECTHTHEPHCAVKAAVERHDIAQSRYDNYLTMVQEIKDRRPVYGKKD